MPKFEYILDIVDTILGRYACRRLLLPCKNNNCVSFADFLKVHNFFLLKVRYSKALHSSLEVMNKMLTDEKEVKTRKLFVVEAYPILYELVNTIRSLRDGSIKKSIRVYSGHDITIEPLIYVLGLATMESNLVTQYVHYASRIVFEVFIFITLWNYLYTIAYMKIDKKYL